MEKERLEWRKDGEGKAGVEEGWRRKGWSRGRMEMEKLE